MLAYTEKQQIVGWHLRNLGNLEILEQMRSETVDLTTICNCNLETCGFLTTQFCNQKLAYESDRLRIWESDRLRIWSDTRLGIRTQKIWTPENLVWQESENLIAYKSGLTLGSESELRKSETLEIWSDIILKIWSPGNLVWHQSENLFTCFCL